MKRSLRMGLVVLTLYLSAATAAMAQTTWIVDKGGGGDFTTIQSCIDSASVVDGDTCQVNAGTYVENINFSGKNITVKSTSGPLTTIIDGNASGSVVTFENGETENAVLDGFTIQNGNSAGYGGGIICVSSSPTVTNCIILNNTSAASGGGMHNTLSSTPTVTNCTFSGNQTGPEGYGGGMGNYQSNPRVTNCTFFGNSAAYGGGMGNYSAAPIVINCSFSDNQTSSSGYGGGMYNTHSSSPTVLDCTFSGNSATYGGGMYNESSSPTVTNCTFSGNTVASGGGGMRNTSSSPTVTDCTFSDNISGYYGGGMSNYGGSPTVTNCTFSGNTAAKYGGGMSNYGGSPTVTNCTFYENQTGPTGYGGGMWNYSASPTVTNCTFSGNTANSGGGMYNEDNSSPTVINSILWGDSPEEILNLSSTFSVTYSDVEGGYTGTGNINADPLFVDPDGPDNIPGNQDDDLHLKSGSPCIDSGTAAGAPDTDIEGKPRPLGKGYDMGAYEFQGMALPWLPLLLLDG